MEVKCNDCGKVYQSIGAHVAKFIDKSKYVCLVCFCKRGEEKVDGME